MTAPQPLTEAELAEIAERAERATPGPWEYPAGARGMYYCVLGPPHPDWHGKYGGAVVASTESMGIPEAQWAPNAQFIAHARTDVPRLAAEVLRLREVLTIAELSMVADPSYDAVRKRIGQALRGEPGEGK